MRYERAIVCGSNAQRKYFLRFWCKCGHPRQSQLRLAVRPSIHRKPRVRMPAMGGSLPLGSSVPECGDQWRPLDTAGKLAIWSPCQSVDGARTVVADLLGLPYNRVRVIRVTMARCLSSTSRPCSRPCRIHDPADCGRYARVRRTGDRDLYRNPDASNRTAARLGPSRPALAQSRRTGRCRCPDRPVDCRLLTASPRKPAVRNSSGETRST